MKNNVEGFTNTSKINEEAAQWVVLLEDTPKLSEQQIQALKDWIAISDTHRECLTRMAQSWGDMDLLSSVMLPQEIRKPSLITQIKAVMFLPFLACYVFVLACLQHKKTWVRPALVFSLFSVLSLSIGITFIERHPVSNNLVLQTVMGEKLTQTMPDGSIVWLNSSSKVEINYTGSYRRINLLSGEAHFDVAKDANRPFEVYANDRLIRAIGTAFSVHKIDDKIEVLVSEGTVELAIVEHSLVVIPDDYQAIKIADNFDNHVNEQSTSSNPQVKKMLGKLTAGQRISIPVDSSVLDEIDELDNSEITRFLSWKEGKLVFAGESLEEVIAEITRHTPVKIDVIDPKLKTMRIGGQFKVGETDTLFYVLESGFGISVNKLNDHHVELRVKK